MGGAIASSLNMLVNDFPLDGHIAMDCLSNFNGDIFAIVGNGVYEGADKSVIELHAFMLKYDEVSTGVKDQEQMPDRRGPGLHVYPNPFNPKLTISFRLNEPGPVEIGVYDLLGRRVTVLYNGPVTTTQASVEWDGRNNAGRTMSSGAYFVRLVSRDGVMTRKAMLLR